MPSFTSSVEHCIKAALTRAQKAGEAEATLEHLLHALLGDPDVISYLAGAGVSIQDLARDVEEALSPIAEQRQAGATTAPSERMRRVVMRAATDVGTHREMVTGADIVAAMLAERDTPGAEALRRHGLLKPPAAATVARPKVETADMPPDRSAIQAAKPQPRSSPLPPEPEAPSAGGPTANRNPLSRSVINLNGHVDYLDPPLGLSFPTILAPDPYTVIARGQSGSALRKAVAGAAADICHFCGLRASKYMEVVGPLSTVTASEAQLACTFCAQVTAIDLIPGMASGVLVHLPEFGQAELNAYARIVYVCRISQGPAAVVAARMLSAVMARKSEARARLGTDDPLVLAALLSGSRTWADRKALDHRLPGIRIYPLDRRTIRPKIQPVSADPGLLAFEEWPLRRADGAADGPAGVRGAHRRARDRRIGRLADRQAERRRRVGCEGLVVQHPDAAVVLVKKLWIGDVLDETTDVPGEQSVQDLVANPTAHDFLKDAFTHAKFIAFASAAAPLVAAAALDGKLDAGCSWRPVQSCRTGNAR